MTFADIYRARDALLFQGALTRGGIWMIYGSVSGIGSSNGRPRVSLSFRESLPFHNIAVDLSPLFIINAAHGTPPSEPAFSLLSTPTHPHFSSTAMDSPLVPLLQRQLETTLQLLLSASSAMTTDEIMMVRIRLTEANLVLGDAVLRRNNDATNGNSISTLSLVLA